MTGSDPTADGRPSPWRWWVCGLLLLATTLNYMDRMTLNQTAYRIQRALGLNNEEYGWLEGAFVFAFGVGTLVTGFIVDKVSVRWVYPLIVTGWSAAGFLTGFARGTWPCSAAGSCSACSRPGTGRAASGRSARW